MERNREMPEKVVLGVVETYHGVKPLVSAKGVVGIGEGEVVGGGARTGVQDGGGATREAVVAASCFSSSLAR